MMKMNPNMNGNARALIHMLLSPHRNINHSLLFITNLFTVQVVVTRHKCDEFKAHDDVIASAAAADSFLYKTTGNNNLKAHMALWHATTTAAAAAVNHFYK